VRARHHRDRRVEQLLDGTFGGAGTKISASQEVCVATTEIDPVFTADNGFLDTGCPLNLTVRCARRVLRPWHLEDVCAASRWHHRGQRHLHLSAHSVPGPKRAHVDPIPDVRRPTS
jgi:hypothetical protein